MSNNLIHDLFTPECIATLQAEFNQIPMPEGWKIKINPPEDFCINMIGINIIAPESEIMNYVRPNDEFITAPSIQILPLPPLVISAAQAIFARLNADNFDSKDYRNMGLLSAKRNTCIFINYKQCATKINTHLKVAMDNGEIITFGYHSVDMRNDDHFIALISPAFTSPLKK